MGRWKKTKKVARNVSMYKKVSLQVTRSEFSFDDEQYAVDTESFIDTTNTDSDNNVTEETPVIN